MLRTQVTILLFLLLIGPNLLIGQKIKLKTYYDKDEKVLKEVYQVQNSVLFGEYRSYYRNGILKVKGNYRYNRPVGVWEYYFQNGNLKMKGELKNKSNYGPWEYYYQNGQLSMEGKFVNGQRQGLWKFYYDNGIIKSKGLYVNDNRSGNWEYYFEDGSKKGIGIYKEGKGLYTEFYPSGNKSKEGIRANGKNQGNWSFYYQDGSLQAIGDYQDGKKTGFWQYFYPNGMVSTEGYFENDKPDKQWVYYFEDGKVSSKGSMKEGLRDGTWKIYGKDGFVKGNIEFLAGEGEYKEYYPNGKVKVSGKIIKGKKNGKWQYYYDTGELEGECIFVNNNGKYTGYYRDGTKKMAGKMDNELMVGIWELYEPNGTLTGYYRPFYDEQGPVFKLEEQAKEGKVRTIWRERRLSQYKFKRKKFTPFQPKVNEFKGIIPAYNPFATLVGGFPVSIEYYIEERLGHELQFNVIRDPFFTKDDHIDINSHYKRGFSIAFRQKFYRPATKIGMFYFAHELRFSKLKHKANVLNTGDPPVPEILDADERKYEYAILVGKRIMKEVNTNGFTVDIYLGVATGFRKYTPNFPETQTNLEIFDSVSTGKVPFSVRAGINLGYLIGVKRR